MILLAALSCTPGPDPALQAELQTQRDEALKDVPDADPQFEPDLVLHISPRSVSQIVEVGLSSAPTVEDKREVFGASLHTTLRVDRAALRRAEGDERFLATVQLEGSTEIDGGMLGRLVVPIRVDAIVEVSTPAEASDAALRVTAKPEAVREIEFHAEGVPASALALLQRPAVREPIRERVEQELLSMPPFPVLAWRKQGLPIRGLRVAPEGAGLRVEMRSSAVHPGRVDPEAGRAKKGFRLDASIESLYWLARTEAFSRDPLDIKRRADEQLPGPLEGRAPALEILPVPTSLAVTGDRFTLGVRLWRMVPSGDQRAPAWWRDYTAEGQISVGEGGVALTVGSVAPGAASARAGRAEPLAAVAEKILLSTVREPLQQTLPSSGMVKVAGHRVEVSLDAVRGEGDMLQVSGEIDLKEEP